MQSELRSKWLSSDILPVPVEITTAEMDRPNGSRVGAIDSVAATVILPAYNEAEALPEVLMSLLAVLDDRCEVIVVDDGSTDDTAAIASRYRCRVVRHQRNSGKGAAVRTGLREARGRFIIVMDADNTYPADAVPRMITLAEEYDFVRGVRLEGKANMPLINRLGNQLFDYVLRTIHGLEGADHLSGLYGLRREALEAMNFTADGFDLEVEIGIKARAHRLRACSLPISYGARLGEKKLRAWRDGQHILRQTLALALVYNPALVFVLPAALLSVLAAILTLIPSGGLGLLPYAGLSLQSLILLALGITAGFQFVVFGVAAALYATEQGIPPRSWLLTLSRRRVRFGAAVFGIVSSLTAVAMLAAVCAQWMVSGGGAFDATHTLLVVGVLLSWGMQAVMAALFISIFARRFETMMPHGPRRIPLEATMVPQAQGIVGSD